MLTSTFNKLVLTCLCCALIQVVQAQSKLPNKQTASLWVPTNLKIDGKANEWNNQFQANNHSTDIFYTIANNSDELYLIVYASSPDVIDKVVERGITFTIKKSSITESDKSFTFPINMDSRALSLTLNPRSMTFSKNNRAEDTTARALDSIMVRNNKILAEKHKWIKVEGVKGLDTLISVYNEDGVRAVGLFNVKKHYTFEMAIKLRLLGLAGNETSKFTYQLKVNGARPIKTSGMATIVIGGGPPPPPEEIAKSLGDLEARLNTRAAPTYFDGEYTLATKP